MLSIILLMCQYTCTLKMVTMFDAGAYCHFSNLKVEVTQRTVTISEYLMALYGIVYCSM